MNDLAKLEAGQPFIGLEPVVGFPYTQTKEYFGLWEEKKK